jgi:hypothetical protein
MKDAVAVFTGGSPAVGEAGTAVADLLDARVRRIGEATDLQDRQAAAAILRKLDASDVVAAVLPAGGLLAPVVRHVITTCSKPIVIVPSAPAVARPLTISRVLLPLDGTWEAAAAVAPTAELLARAGVDLVVLHVFTEATVPRFWDQAAHARDAWEPEFLARYCPHPGVRLHLRSGSPGEHVVTVAAEERVDLIALGWSQRLDPDRAETVRQTVADTRVPVLLVPVSPEGATAQA